MSFLCAAIIISAGLSNLSPELPASYRMEVTLDTASQIVTGSETIFFLNPTDDTLESLCFHLYPNAFRDTSSVLAHESREIRQDILAGNTASLTVSDIVIDSLPLDSTSITEKGTLLYLTLPESLGPGETTEISLSFRLTLPLARMRFGYNARGNYLLSHWHPILCGYQRGRLVENEYHQNSEFFSNFSSYYVRLVLPLGFDVGSTGELTLVEKDSSRAIWQAAADTVIDFAFACGTGFEVSESDTLGIKIRYLIEKGHVKLRDRADWITKFSLAFNSNWFFKYPYPTFTLVDFDSGAEGMELPGMITLTFPGERLGPAAGAILNLGIAHEVTHEWFYGMVATNEAEEPWLDEGITTYVTSRLLEAGGDSLGKVEVFGYNIPLDISGQLVSMMSKAEYPINLKSWEYPDMFAYAGTVYYRASLMLRTLEQWVGRDKFDAFLKNYANLFRFRHPIWEDFVNAATTTTHSDMTGFFYQFINGTARVDYEVRSLEYKPSADTGAAGTYEITVAVARELDGALPQRLSVALENGSVIDTLWDGARGNSPRVQEITLLAKSKPASATLAPYALDENTANNSLYIKSFGGRLASFEWDMIFLKEFFLSLFL